MFQARSSILANDKVGPSTYVIRFSAVDIAKEAVPGQFVMVRVNHLGLDPLLRRPFSIYFVHDDTVSLLYRIVGRGTEELSRLRTGDPIDVIGPLGRGFSIPSSTDTVVLVAGGIGIAPLAFLAQWIHRNRAGTDMAFYYGAGTRHDLIGLDIIEQLPVTLHISTEDGSMGKSGLVTEVLAQEYRQMLPATICACGPEAMLRALAALPFIHRHTLLVSLESAMACGIGACLGCVITTRSGYTHVCQEGPVFDIRELNW